MPRTCGLGARQLRPGTQARLLSSLQLVHRSAQARHEETQGRNGHSVQDALLEKAGSDEVGVPGTPAVLMTV